ncbi:hypothetical protein PIB30_043923 [Stylosanthes scabra]|uniref:Uncharacterized protein n=1 Tax=Stylosanthes scabra TaxID=79078 RepID=A0ABU6VGF0_9FABA|nr:hypothetical protein [Stylosanthes scabra]
MGNPWGRGIRGDGDGGENPPTAGIRDGRTLGVGDGEQEQEESRNNSYENWTDLAGWTEKPLTQTPDRLSSPPPPHPTHTQHSLLFPLSVLSLICSHPLRRRNSHLRGPLTWPVRRCPFLRASQPLSSILRAGQLLSSLLHRLLRRFSNFDLVEELVGE